MPSPSRTKKSIPLPVLLIAGFSAGIINGLLGAGGGIVLIFVLAALLDGRDVYANAIAVTLPITLLSTIRYAADGQLPISDFVPLLFPAAIGGIFGAWLLDRIDVSLTKKIFAALIIWSGINMLRG